MKHIIHIIVGLSLVIAAYLRFDQITTLIPFIGDQAWYYLSARDMMLTGEIPLVGITASRTWLHQGAYWTYMIGPVMWLLDFHPVAPALVGALSGVIATWLMYYVTQAMFSAQAGILAALLYATSPLVILNERMAFTLSPVPVASMVMFYALYRVIQGHHRAVFVLVGSLLVLWNLNLASVIVWPIVIAFLLIGRVKNRPWFLNVWRYVRKKHIRYRMVLMGLIFLLPFLLYDIQNGFPQTVKFAAWFLSRPLMILVQGAEGFDIGTAGEMLPYMYEMFGRMILMPSYMFALVLLTVSFTVVGYVAWQRIRKNDYEDEHVMLSFFLGLSLLGIFVNGTPSFAYMTTLFPHIMMLVAVGIAYVVRKVPTLLIIPGVMVVLNAYALVQSSYLVRIPDAFGPSLGDHTRVAQEIVDEADGKSYRLVGSGEGAEFESFTMSTEYLTWWLGHGPEGNHADSLPGEGSRGADMVFEVIRRDETLSVTKL